MEPRTIEQMAIEIAPELDRLINDILARPGGDTESERRRAALKTFLWDNKVGLLRIAEFVAETQAESERRRVALARIMTECNAMNKGPVAVMIARDALAYLPNVS